MERAGRRIRENAAFHAAVRARAGELVRAHGAERALALARETRGAAAPGRAKLFAYNVEAVLAERAGRPAPDGSGRPLAPDLLNGLEGAFGKLLSWLEGRLAPLLGEGVESGEAELAAARLGVTAKQLECLRHAAEGLSAKASGQRFDPPLHWRTVEGHLARAYARLGANTKAQAIALARDARLLAPPG